MLWGRKEGYSPKLEVLIVSSTWAWFPVKMSLPSTAQLTRQYCLPNFHKPLQGVSVLGSAHLKGQWRVSLPQLLHDSPSQDWFMTQQGIQTIHLCVGYAIGWGLLEGCTLAWSPQLWSRFTSDFEVLLFLYLLINWLWFMRVCATYQKPTNL